MFLALVFKHYRDKQTSAFEQLASHRMKRFILLLAIVSTSTFSVLAQGTINYATRFPIEPVDQMRLRVWPKMQAHATDEA